MRLDRNVYANRTLRKVDGREPPPKQPAAQDKLLAYFPAESLTLFAALSPLLDTALDDSALTVALWLALAGSALLGLLIQRRIWRVVRKGQLLTSVVAFLVYVAALGGPFERMDWYRPVWAVIASVVVSSFIVFFPAPVKPD